MFGNLRKLISKRESDLSLGLFRVMFFGALAWEGIRYLVYGWLQPLFVDPVFHFRFAIIPIEVPHLGATAIHLIFCVLILASVLAALDVFQRQCAVVAAIILTYVFLYDSAYSLLLNHLYLMVLVAWILAVCPQSHAFSLGRYIAGKEKRHGSMMALPLSLLRAQIAIVYFFAGVTKMNPAWLEGKPLSMWLTPIGLQSYAVGMSWAGALFDLSVPFLVLYSPTRTLIITLAIVFHAANAFLFHIGVFPVIAISLTLLFLPSNWPSRFYRGLTSYTSNAAGDVEGKHSIGQVPTVLVFAYFLLQIFLPFRPFIYRGNPNLTEEGGYFSWRMMAAEKTGTVRFRLLNASTGAEAEWDSARDLTPLQIKSMSTQPELVRQYAHHIADAVQNTDGFRPEVHADMSVTVNGDTPVKITNFTADLATEEYSVDRYDWIL